MTTTETPIVYEPIAAERAPTGVPGLDAVLDGGLVRGGIYLVMGRPGTGKTTLGNQMCFAHVARGGRAVYATLLSESHGTMVRNLQGMSFFDPTVINDALHYVGAYVTLREEKFAGLLSLLRRVIRDENASLLVIDGIASARSIADNELALKEFIVELQVLSTMTNCTTVLLANMTPEEANGPEHTMVDGLIDLAYTVAPHREMRTLRVMKLRGARHLLGRNEVTIDSERGLVVHPQTETLLARTARPAPALSTRERSGSRELDTMLDGGVLSGTGALVLGFPGSGKTVLALSFLAEGAALGDQVLYLGFAESPDRLLQAADTAGIPLREHVASGRARMLWQPSHLCGIDILASEVLEDVQARGVRRIVLDGIDGFRRVASEPERLLGFLDALLNELRARGVTTLITEEAPSTLGSKLEICVPTHSSMFDTVIVLEYVGVGASLHRLLTVVKQRASRHEFGAREMFIGPEGLRLAKDGASADKILLREPGGLAARGPVTPSRVE